MRKSSNKEPIAISQTELINKVVGIIKSFIKSAITIVINVYKYYLIIIFLTSSFISVEFQITIIIRNELTLLFVRVLQVHVRTIRLKNKRQKLELLNYKVKRLKTILYFVIDH